MGPGNSHTEAKPKSYIPHLLLAGYFICDFAAHGPLTGSFDKGMKNLLNLSEIKEQYLIDYGSFYNSFLEGITGGLVSLKMNEDTNNFLNKYLNPHCPDEVKKNINIENLKLPKISVQESKPKAYRKTVPRSGK